MNIGDLTGHIPPQVLVYGAIVLFGLYLLTTLSNKFLDFLGPIGVRIREGRQRRASDRADEVQKLRDEVDRLSTQEQRHARMMTEWYRWAGDVTRIMAAAGLETPPAPWQALDAPPD